MAITVLAAATGNSTTSTASVSTGATNTAAVGTYMLVVVAAKNAGTSGVASLTTVTDAVGNTYTQRALINYTPTSAANDGITLGVYTAPVTIALSSHTITANFSPNTLAKVIVSYRLTLGANESLVLVAAGTTGSTGNTTTHSAATISVANGDHIFGLSAIETNAAVTGDSDTSNGSWSAISTQLANSGTSSTSATASQQNKAVTGTGNQDFAVTTASAADSARTYLVLRAAITEPVVTSLGSGTSIGMASSVATGATITAQNGDWLVVIAAVSNFGTAGASAITGVSDNEATFTAAYTEQALINYDPGAAGEGATLGIYTVPVTGTITTRTVTVSLVGGFDAEAAVQVYLVRPPAGETISFIAADTTGSTGLVTSHAAATVSVTDGDIIFGAAAIESDDAVTGDSDTTNGSWSTIVTRLADDGADLAAMTCSSQYKTVNATGNQSWACTTGTARDSARSYLILRSATSVKSLVADVGTYELTGTDATTRRNLPMVADPGDYALTGTDATTRYGYRLDATTPASYALTGTDTPTIHQWKLDATAPASYALTGTDVNLNKGQTLGVDSGSYALTGTDVSLRRNLPMVADGGSYLLTGTDAATSISFKIDATTAGAYLLTGTDVALMLASNKVIAAEAGTYALTGTDVTLTLASNNKTLAADAGSYALTGTDVATTHQWKLDATTPGSYSLAGQVADTLHQWKLDATTAGAYALAGSDANALHGFKVDATTAGSYVLTGTDASTLHRWVLDATTAGTYALTGTDVTLTHPFKLDATVAGSYTLIGTDATPVKTGVGAFVLVADAGSYSLTGTDTATLHAWRIAAGDEGFLLDELGNPILDELGNPIALEGPIGGIYALTGTDATLTKSTAAAFTITADPGFYLLTGTDVTLTAGTNNKTITADPGSYLLTGISVTLISSAQPVLPTRGEWPEKERRKRRRREAERDESVRTARAARDALRASIERLFDGGEYDAPTDVLEEAQATAEVVRRLPRLPLRDLQVVEDLIERIQELVRQRLLDEMQTDVATKIAKQHLVDSIAIADEVYRRTRQDYLIKTLLLIAE